MKADKRKGKKYALGGPTSYSGEDTGEGVKMSTRRGGDEGGSSGVSFKQAFKAAKDGSVFEWNGKKYKKEYAEKKASVPAPSEVKVTKTETSIEAPSVSSPRSGGRGSKPGSTSVAPYRFSPKPFEGARQLRDFLRRDVEEKAERNRGAADRFGEFIRNTRMVGGAPDYMKDESGRIRNPSRDEEGMRGGGRIKKYRGGGSVSSASKRADGIAKKGKTRGKIC